MTAGIGPGKYDDLATYCREKAGANGVIVLIFEGNRGHGFSCQFTKFAMQAKIPAVLRQMAADIEGVKQ